jgi:hypothetical protein
MTSCDLPALQRVDYSFGFVVADISRFHAPLLTFIGGSFGISSMKSMTSINLASLTYVTGNFDSYIHVQLQEVDVSKLAHIGGAFQFYNAPILTKLSLPSLTFVGAVFEVMNNGMLMSLAVPVLLYAPRGLNMCNRIIPAPATLTPDQCAIYASICNLVTCPS